MVTVVHTVSVFIYKIMSLEMNTFIIYKLYLKKINTNLNYVQFI